MSQQLLGVVIMSRCCFSMLTSRQAHYFEHVFLAEGEAQFVQIDYHEFRLLWDRELTLRFTAPCIPKKDN
jgi:hypothetical protein